MQKTLVLEDLNPEDLAAILRDNSSTSPIDIYKLDVRQIGDKFYNITTAVARKLRYE